MADEKIIDGSEVAELELPLTDESPPIAPQLIHAPLGEVLLAAREAKKLTQKDVSNSLRLSLKQITALETDDFASLPEAMITRGFIRNYARLLEIDAEPLLTSYRGQMPDKTPAKLSVHSSMNTIMYAKESKPWLIYISSGLIVLVFLLAWLFYVDYMPKSGAKTKPQAVALPIATSAEVALPEAALPAAERLANETVDTINLDAAEIAVPANVPEVIATPTVNPLVADSVSPQLALAATAKKVSITVDEQTWIRVSNQADAVVYERILEAGNSDSFEAEPPLNVQIGNAKASKVTFSGKPFDLIGHTKNNVARFVLQ